MSPNIGSFVMALENGFQQIFIFRVIFPITVFDGFVPNLVFWSFFDIDYFWLKIELVVVVVG